MRADLVPDDLWERVAPLLPPAPERRHRHPGRLRVPDRAALAGIMYVLRTGVAWRDVPAETVGCSGVTAWRRLRDWTEAGVWPRLPLAERAPSLHEALCELPPDCAPLTELCRADSWIWTSAPWTARMSEPSKGGSRRPLARRPRPSRLQAPPDRRPSRNPARRHAHRRQPPRCHPTAAASGCRPADPGPARTPSRQAPVPVRRPRPRLRQVPPPTVEARHQAADRPTRRHPRVRAGEGALDGRARFRLVAPVPATPDPLRPTR